MTPPSISLSATNRAMKCCARATQWPWTLDLLQRLRRWRLVADRYSFGAALVACEKALQWPWALALLREAERGDPVLYSSVMSACNKAEQWAMALEVFQELQTQRCSADVVVYNGAISAAERGALWPLALHLLAELSQSSLQPSVVSVSTAMSACERGSQWCLALQLFDPSEEMSDEIAFGAAISACAEGGQWRLALHYFSLASARQHPRERTPQPPAPSRQSVGLVLRNALLNALGRGNQWQKALWLLGADGWPKDVISYNAAINACEEGSQWNWALYLLSSLQQQPRIQCNVISYNSVLSSCEAASHWTLALLLLRAAEAKGLFDVITYSAAISACEKAHRWQWACQLLTRLREQELQGNVVTYSSAILACHWGEQWQSALELLRTLQKDRLQGNIMTYNASIAACHAGGQWKRALSLFAELEAMTLESSSITFNALLSVCARQRQWAQAFDLLQSFPQKSWDVVTYAEAANDAALWDVLLGRSGAGNAPELLGHLQLKAMRLEVLQPGVKRGVAELGAVQSVATSARFDGVQSIASPMEGVQPGMDVHMSVGRMPAALYRHERPQEKGYEPKAGLASADDAASKAASDCRRAGTRPKTEAPSPGKPKKEEEAHMRTPQVLGPKAIQDQQGEDGKGSVKGGGVGGIPEESEVPEQHSICTPPLFTPAQLDDLHRVQQQAPWLYAKVGTPMYDTPMHSILDRPAFLEQEVWKGKGGRRDDEEKENLMLRVHERMEFERQEKEEMMIQMQQLLSENNALRAEMQAKPKGPMGGPTMADRRISHLLEENQRLHQEVRRLSWVQPTSKEDDPVFATPNGSSGCDEHAGGRGKTKTGAEEAPEDRPREGDGKEAGREATGKGRGAKKKESSLEDDSVHQQTLNVILKVVEGMQKIQDRMSQGGSTGQDQDPETVRHSVDLPKLAEWNGESAPIDFSDWLLLLAPLMADLTPSSEEWWTLTLEEARQWYQKHLVKSPLDRLTHQIAPSTKLSMRKWSRLEKRVQVLGPASSPALDAFESFFESMDIMIEMLILCFRFHVMIGSTEGFYSVVATKDSDSDCSDDSENSLLQHFVRPLRAHRGGPTFASAAAARLPPPGNGKIVHFNATVELTDEQGVLEFRLDHSLDNPPVDGLLDRLHLLGLTNPFVQGICHRLRTTSFSDNKDWLQDDDWQDQGETEENESAAQSPAALPVCHDTSLLPVQISLADHLSERYCPATTHEACADGLSSGGFLREWSDFPQGALLGIAYLRLQQEELVAGQRAWLLELLLSERVGRELVQLHNLGVAVQRARLGIRNLAFGRARTELAAFYHKLHDFQTVQNEMKMSMAFQREQMQWARRAYCLDSRALRIDLLNAVKEDVRDHHQTYASRIDTLLVVHTLLLTFALATLQYSDQFVPVSGCVECEENEHPWLVTCWVYAVSGILILPFWGIVLLIWSKLQLDHWLESLSADVNVESLGDREGTELLERVEGAVTRLSSFVVEHQESFKRVWNQECRFMISAATVFLWVSCVLAILITAGMFWLFLQNHMTDQHRHAATHFALCTILGLLAPVAYGLYFRLPWPLRGPQGGHLHGRTVESPTFEDCIEPPEGQTLSVSRSVSSSMSSASSHAAALLAALGRRAHTALRPGGAREGTNLDDSGVLMAELPSGLPTLEDDLRFSEMT
ncbi:unnamed protein product [Durusdinium trenchii]|uniref:Pentatricopeptide repeat-containing protein, chloroplastic n=1 Tax=Durusdinium trenchii TaxID=1381693 RepID=A0ABP0HUR2_9DINO